ncbi:hypothetical protein ES705_35418 [subsurface metagenome]
MPGKIEVVHHSVVDWDFERGANARSLDATRFISAPTSLHFTTDPVMGSNAILSRLPSTQCLPQGEVRTWIWRTGTLSGPCTFRNQAALGSAGVGNCYRVALWGRKAYFHRYINHSSILIGTWPFIFVYNAWHHIRVFWYNGETPGGTPALCVDLYREVAGEWIKVEPTFYDTANWWKDSAINRCGPFSHVQPNYYTWFDDTEIWGPV